MKLETIKIKYCDNVNKCGLHIRRISTGTKRSVKRWQNTTFLRSATYVHVALRFLCERCMRFATLLMRINACNYECANYLK